MKNIEKKISYFVSSQFPDFYKEEGPTFIKFVQSYFEWMETFGSPGEDATNHLYQARSLTDYRDIDTTLDEFLVHFKEKYLKNIQFDVATNKPLLVKNSLNLYRSKGTERSIDLFFKLVYGTNAEVSYPSEKIFRLSDGVWYKPEYLEVTPNRYNVNYVGKQIIGARSGAKAFVEKYIKRKTQRGYVDILYISNIQGDFINNEALGINKSNVPTFEKAKTSRILGSVKRATVRSKGKEFEIGDLVNLVSSNRGLGSIARVANTTTATGVVDFIFEDGGYGYTLTANAIVSEKVIDFDNVDITPNQTRYAVMFEELVQPNINVAFSSATGTLVVGDVVTRYSNNVAVSVGTVIEVDQTGNTGSITVSHTSGAFVNAATYYTESNTYSLYANTIEDRSISGKVMGISNTVQLTVTSPSNFSTGDMIIQGFNSNSQAIATITDITGNTFTVETEAGAFKETNLALDYYYSIESGTISTNVNTMTVTGSGTEFTQDLVESVLYETGSNATLGIIKTVTNTTSLILYSNSGANATSAGFASAKQFKLRLSSNTNVNTDIENVRLDIGLFDIRKMIYSLSFSAANNATIQDASEIHQYDVNGNKISKGRLLTVEYSANAGTLTYLPTCGHFDEAAKIYTNSNTCVATISSLEVTEEGGDYISSVNSRMATKFSNTHGTPFSISFGTDADFDVGSLTETEVIVTGTDLLGSNNAGYLDSLRKSLNVSSNTGFVIHDIVIQDVNKIAFNPSTAVNVSTGFIALDTANSKFLAGDAIQYQTATGNTVPNGLSNNDTYYVTFANTTGIKIAYGWDSDITITSAVIPDFANNVVNEAGHYFYSKAAASIYDLGSGALRIKDVFNSFGATGGTANTTQSSNSNVYVYSNNLVNTSITSITSMASVTVGNQAYMSLNLRQNSYGFPKNTTGNIKDTIYSCLGFDAMEIGIIASIANINPGTDYNVDPFVIVHEEQISAFGRNDFNIYIANTTKAYTTGEKVYQSLPDLIKYDLKVDSGVYGNSYSEVARTFNNDEEVYQANDFILIPSNTISFNANTEVTSNSDFIIDNHPFVTGDYIRYYTATGNTVLTGLSNSSYYYIVSANTSGFKLAATEGGANIDITASSTSEEGHYIVNYSNPFANNTRLIYSIPNGNTVLSGLTNETLYYAVGANSVGLQLSATEGGANVNITANSTGGETNYLTTVPGFLPGDVVYQNVLTDFNANTEVTANAILLSPQPYTDGDEVTYYTATGNTAISELGNNTVWYIVSANSTSVKLSNTVGGNVTTINATVTSESGHYLNSFANATVDSVRISSGNNFVRVKGTTNHFANGYVLYSNTNVYVSANVSNVASVSFTSTAKGIVKEGSNTSVLKVKRISFENTFEEGSALIGESSGANSIITSIEEDEWTYPIGLNAVVDADTSVANGQISELQIIDSGFGYTNNELVTLESEDENTASALVVIDGSGISKGAYKSTRGFLSDDNYIHDGDYYQEYSYEIFSKIAVDKYSDMFKKVMHMAGTKFFGSVAIEDESNVEIQITSSDTEYQISFNAQTDVSSGTDKITVGIEKDYRVFNASSDIDSNNDFIEIAANPYSNGDYIQYYTSLGNTAVTGLSNSSYYYVVSANTTGVKLSLTSNGSAIDITSGVSEIGHNFVGFDNPLSNGDVVVYTTDSGNTAVSGLSNNELYYVVNASPLSVSLSATANGSAINLTASGATEVGHYLTNRTYSQT